MLTLSKFVSAHIGSNFFMHKFSNLSLKMEILLLIMLMTGTHYIFDKAIEYCLT